MAGCPEGSQKEENQREGRIGREEYRMSHELNEIVKDAAKFSMEYDPDMGIRVETMGKPVDEILLTCLALISTAMKTVKKEKQNACDVREVLNKAMDMAFMLYINSEVISVDLTGMEGQAQDADQ